VQWCGGGAVVVVVVVVQWWWWRCVMVWCGDVVGAGGVVWGGMEVVLPDGIMRGGVGDRGALPVPHMPPHLPKWPACLAQAGGCGSAPSHLPQGT
jgi:hypothetical protein